MSDIELSSLNSLVAEAIINETLDKINKDNTLSTLSENHILLYLCSLVLESTKEHLKDEKITSEERVQLITDVICVVITRMPISDALKKFLHCFVKDGEIKKIIKDADEHASSKVSGCFGRIFRACMRSSSKQK